MQHLGKKYAPIWQNQIGAYFLGLLDGSIVLGLGMLLKVCSTVLSKGLKKTFY
jgi:hypothetical protein